MYRTHRPVRCFSNTFFSVDSADARIPIILTNVVHLPVIRFVININVANTEQHLRRSITFTMTFSIAHVLTKAFIYQYYTFCMHCKLNLNYLLRSPLIIFVYYRISQHFLLYSPLLTRTILQKYCVVCYSIHFYNRINKSFLLYSKQYLLKNIGLTLIVDVFVFG